MYPLAEESPWPRIVGRLVVLAILLVLLYWIGSWILGLFGVGNPLERASAQVSVEQGTVQVSIQGQGAQNAENGMALFPGDTVSTGNGAHALVRFFDGTQARLDQNTQLALAESARGKEDSQLRLQLGQGTVWVLTPSVKAFTGSIVRTVATPVLSYALPSSTEAILSPSSLSVFSADGLGVSVTAPKHSAFVIGEGQQWAMPAGALGDDVFAYRTPVDEKTLQSPFLITSRQERSGGTASSSAAGTPDILTVSAPADNATVGADSVTVQGKVTAQVFQVLINGHVALLDRNALTFAQQLSPPSGQSQFTIDVQAIDADNNVVADVKRIVHVQAQGQQSSATLSTVASPAFTEPAKTGETYQTSQQEIILRGTSPKDAAGMMINNYKLQLFTPGKGTWSYLASTALGSLKPGVNQFDAFALDASGNKSAPAHLTIILGNGPQGVVAASSSSGSPGAGSSSSAINPATLPKNPPLYPGTLTVTGPTAGTSHVETGTGFLLEGATSPKTSTLWINDYQLKLYLPGKKTWNYIASAAFGNLKPGTNVYHIIARDEKYQIIDQLDYTVEYQPK